MSDYSNEGRRWRWARVHNYVAGDLQREIAVEYEWPCVWDLNRLAALKDMLHPASGCRNHSLTECRGWHKRGHLLVVRFVLLVLTRRNVQGQVSPSLQPRNGQENGTKKTLRQARTKRIWILRRKVIQNRWDSTWQNNRPLKSKLGPLKYNFKAFQMVDNNLR